MSPASYTWFVVLGGRTLSGSPSLMTTCDWLRHDTKRFPTVFCRVFSGLLRDAFGWYGISDLLFSSPTLRTRLWKSPVVLCVWNKRMRMQTCAHNNDARGGQTPITIIITIFSAASERACYRPMCASVRFAFKNAPAAIGVRSLVPCLRHLMSILCVCPRHEGGDSRVACVVVV